MEISPIQLHTERLLLTGFSQADMTFIFENHTKDEIMKILGHRSDEEYLTEEQKQRNGYGSYNRTFILFLLTEKASNRIIGRCGLHNWNKDHKRAEIGYHLSDENDKRKGFMSETVSAVLDFGFNELKLHRIEALVGSTNIPSLRIIEKHGFVKEGLLRKHMLIAGEYQDSVLFAKLNDDHEME